MMMMMFMFFIFMLITSIFLLINKFIVFKMIKDREKMSPFECGFDPLNSNRLPISVQFYLIAVIFLVFDVEVIIFIPMISSFLMINYIYWLMTTLLFILILLVGLYMEWYNGALNWLK